MPHLQFEINKKVKSEQKLLFIKFVEKKFSEIMQTGIDHIAVTIRELERQSISLGRANNNEDICLMNLDIRSGRSSEQRIKLVRDLISGVESFFEIKKSNQYVTITTHLGEEFNFFERSLDDWTKNDDPAKGKS